MVQISGTDEWKIAHPGAVIGLLELSGVENGHRSLLLDDRKREIEAELVMQYGEFSRQELRALPVMSAYHRYYKRFKKTYHVQLQVESIALKGKNLPGMDTSSLRELKIEFSKWPSDLAGSKLTSWASDIPVSLY